MRSDALDPSVRGETFSGFALTLTSDTLTCTSWRNWRKPSQLSSPVIVSRPSIRAQAMKDLVWNKRFLVQYAFETVGSA